MIWIYLASFPAALLIVAVAMWPLISNAHEGARRRDE